MPDPAPILQGALYPTWSALREAVDSWSIDAHFSYRVPTKDRTRADYRCREQEAGCSWRIYASIPTTGGGDIMVKIVQPQHTCVGAGHSIREVCNTQSWLRSSVPKHLFVTRSTKVREIVQAMEMHYNVTVNSEAARLVRIALIQDRLQQQAQQAQRFQPPSPTSPTIVASKPNCHPLPCLQTRNPSHMYSTIDFDLPRGSHGYENPTSFFNNRNPASNTSNWRPNSYSRPSTPPCIAPPPPAPITPTYPSPPASSPPIEPPCLPPPEEIYRSASRDLLDFTPNLLAYMTAAESGRLIFRRVPLAQVSAWLRRYHEIVDHPDIRYEYDSLTQRFMVKCSPCAVHESFSIFFKTDVILGMASKLGSRTMKKILQVSSGSTFSGFSTENVVDSERTPTAFVKVAGMTHPSVVVETGWTEKMANLKKDANTWLCGTMGVTRVVIVVCFTEGKSPIAEPDEDPLEKDEPPAAGTGTGTDKQNTARAVTPAAEDVNTIPPTAPPSVSEEESAESSLISSITKATLFTDLVASLLSLHSSNTLTKPLLGPISGTLHLFRANPTFKSIIEFYTTSILPPGDPSFRLSFADLLSPDLASEHGLDPEGGLDFDMAELRDVVEAQMVDMCRERVGRRAKSLMKEKGGVWGKARDFAESKRGRGAGSESGEDWNEKRKKQ